MPESYEFNNKDEWLSLMFAVWLQDLKDQAPIPEWP